MFVTLSSGQHDLSSSIALLAFIFSSSEVTENLTCSWFIESSPCQGLCRSGSILLNARWLLCAKEWFKATWLMNLHCTVLPLLVRLLQAGVRTIVTFYLQKKVGSCINLELGNSAAMTTSGVCKCIRPLSHVTFIISDRNPRCETWQSFPCCWSIACKTEIAHSMLCLSSEQPIPVNLKSRRGWMVTSVSRMSVGMKVRPLICQRGRNDACHIWSDDGSIPHEFSLRPVQRATR